MDVISEAREKYQLEVHAYCLMNNHYHLLIRTPQPNLSAIMKYINSVYTQRSNILKGRDGPIFRGRYKSILVDGDAYLLQLSRYIHLTPVTARIVEKPENYPWSSYRHYLKQIEEPKWLFCSKVLEIFFSNNNGKVERSQKTDLEKFYALVDLTDFEKLREELEYWHFFYNWKRPHGALKGKYLLEINY